MPKNPPENHPNREGSPVREAFLQPRITRRSALKMAGAAALPALIRRARAADGSVLRVAFAVQPATLDPQKMRVGGLEYNAAAYVFNRLTTQDAQLRVLPDLATSWEASPDLKTWTFHLRPGVKFHNGKPFDASDVLFTYKRILDKEVGCVLRVNFSIVSNIEAVDPLTVRFTLSAPYSDLPAAMAAYQALIVSESMMDTLTTHPIGTGPFRFEINAVKQFESVRHFPPSTPVYSDERNVSSTRRENRENSARALVPTKLSGGPVTPRGPEL
jgi:ABC-type transport system substrate-binding protein